MKRWFCALFWLLGAVSLCDAGRPNVILFVTDDQRSDFLGCAGHDVLQTPTIDGLAADGIRFDNAFVTTPICAASRASILTGAWELHHGYTFGTPPLAAGSMRSSYPSQLRAAGYRTGFVGKFGIRSTLRPRDALFDEFHPIGQPFVRKDPNGLPQHVTDRIGVLARQFLGRCNEEQPFCLSVSFAAPHAVDGERENPYPHPISEKDLYKDATVNPPRVSSDYWEQLPEFLRDSMHRDRWHWRWDTAEKYVENTKSYFRMISAIDRVIGEVLTEVAELGFADNTVVVFTSDNGYYKGSRGFAGKWSHFDESLRVPLIVYDPRLDKSLRGRVVSQLVLNVDLAPTLVALAGIGVSTFQGRSLMPLIMDTPVEWRSDFFCEHRLQNDRIPKWEGVRTERYAYARYFEHLPEGEFLHDLQKDPLELHNAVNDPALSDVLKELRVRCVELSTRLRRSL